MAKNLLQLSVYFNHPHYSKIARQMIQKVVGNIDYPSAFSNWLDAYLDLGENQKELAICSKKAQEFGLKINQNYWPHVWLAGCDKKSDLPFLQNRFNDEKDLFYICQNQSCQQPISDINLALNQLKFL
jgi:hypothetical protein